VNASYTIKGDEFFLEGHFKDEPIFPASIVFEAMGQAAGLWVLENAPAQVGKPSSRITSSLRHWTARISIARPSPAKSWSSNRN